jgi:NAD-dependent DNA ligase
MVPNIPEILTIPSPIKETKEMKPKKKASPKAIKQHKKPKLVIGEDLNLKQSSSHKEKEKDSNKSKDDVDEWITAFKKLGIQVLTHLKEEQIAEILRKCDDAFHTDKEPLMTDMQYDIVKEYMEQKYPDNPIFQQFGAPVEKNKVDLPYEMASMDKIKPDTNALNDWKGKYKGPYVVSCKLDGVSGLYTTEGTTPKLYTRGNGKVGQDVSHLIPFLKLPKKKGIVVRGEFIMPKSVFAEKYASQFANIRNLVAGIVNRLTLDDKVKDLHFVAYEVIQPELKPSKQIDMLITTGFEVVHHKMETNITNNMLSELLVEWRKDYIYEIDGIIVTDDNIYPRKSGNPQHSFAFKMVLSDQMAEAKVVNVIWTPSKDGYLKPRVQIEPIKLGGVTIEYATGFNAAFIENNKIGVGALIQIIRSGDVIPHIRGVTVPATEAKMPDVPYKWNDTHVDIMLEDVSSNMTVVEKNITGFFRGIGVDGLSSGNVARIVAAGYDTVPKIIRMTKEELLKIEGFKDKLTTKIYDGIHSALDKASLLIIMSASNIFGRGLSDKKMEPILEQYPTILTSNASSDAKIQQVTQVKGMAKKSAEAFVEKIPAFLTFIEECGLQDKLASTTIVLKPVDMSHPLYKKTVVMTGVRDEAVKEALKTVGATLGSSVSKNTFIVIAKTQDEDTGKAAEARKLNIPIVTPQQFMSMYFSP